MITTPRPGSVHQRLLLRTLAAVGLAGTALIHLEQLPDTWNQTPLLGAMFAVLVAAATAAAIAIVFFDSRLLWLAVFLTAAAPIGGYILTRSMAVPFDDQDVGNWFEPIGLVSLFVEACLITLCAVVLLAGPARGATAQPGSVPADAATEPDGAFVQPDEFVKSPGNATQ